MKSLPSARPDGTAEQRSSSSSQPAPVHVVRETALPRTDAYWSRIQDPSSATARSPGPRVHANIGHMIDALSERLLTLKQAAALVPSRSGSGTVHPDTIRRWTRAPSGGPRLDLVRIGGTLFTSREALVRFLDETNRPVSSVGLEHSVYTGRVGGSSPSPGILSVEQLGRQYGAFVERTYRFSDEHLRIREAFVDAVRLFGSLPAGRFGALRLRETRDAMVARGLCRTTVNDHVGRIKRAYRWAAENELIPASAYQAVECVTGLRRWRTEAREPRDIRPVQIDAVETVRPHLSRQVVAMIDLQLTTGMRPGEVVQLRPCDVDVAREPWVYEPAVHKGAWRGHTRRIMIGPSARELLGPWLDPDHEDLPVFSPREAEKERRAELRRRRRTKVQPSQRDRSRKHPRKLPGDSYTVHSYRRAIHRACDAACIERWSPNQLRHAAATEIRRRFGLEAAKSVLGHTTTRMTEYYAERDWTEAARVAEAFG